MKSAPVPISTSFSNTLKCFLLVLILTVISQTARAQDFGQVSKEAEEAANKGNFDQAILIYSKYIEGHPSETMAYLNRGVAYMNKAMTDKVLMISAISDFDKAIELDPKNTSAYYFRGKTFFMQHNYSRAITNYNKVADLNPSSMKAPVLLERGIAYCKRNREGDMDKGLEDFKQAIEKDKNDKSIPEISKSEYLVFNNNNVSQEVKDKLKAMGYSSHSCEDSPESQGMLAQAQDFYNKKDYDKAVEICNRVLAMNAICTRAYFIRGDAYFDKKDFNNAVADYDKAAELDPKNIYVFYSLGACYRSLHNYEQAIANFTKAIANRPDHPYGYSDRAYCYVKRNAAGDADLALADFQKAVTIDPASVQEVFGGWMSESISKDMKDKIQQMINDREIAAGKK